MCNQNNTLEKILNTINEQNDVYGNTVLYNACQISQFEEKKVKELSGMIWLIGRSYAASPQRRSYGISKKFKPVTRITSKGKEETIKQPIWLVKSANDGTDSFFDFITKHIVESNEWEKLTQLIKELNNQKYFDNKDDIVILANTINCVGILNRLVKRASEKFDGVPQDNKVSFGDVTDYAYCKNQISFCSKFLHFYLPNTVFIIDTISEKGGKTLFDRNALLFSHVVDSNETDSNEDEQINNSKFCKIELTEEIESEHSKLVNSINDKLKNEHDNDCNERQNLDKNKHFLSDYIEHCARAYLLLKSKKGCMQSPSTINVSLPRFADAILMHIRSEKEAGNTKTYEKKTYIKTSDPNKAQLVYMGNKLIHEDSAKDCVHKTYYKERL